MDTAVSINPELLTPPYIDEARNAAKQHAFETFNDIDRYKEEIVPNIFSRYPDVELMGVGIEAIVIGDPEDPDKVISYEYKERERDPYYFLEIYQMHKILNILYPSHFPRIYGVDQDQAMTVRERVKYDGPEKHIDIFKHDGYPEKLEQHIRDTSSLQVHLDYNFKNFILDKNGKYKYIDLVEADEKTAQRLDAEKALAYFDKKFATKLETKAAQIQRERLTLAIERLKEIDQARKKLATTN